MTTIRVTDPAERENVVRLLSAVRHQRDHHHGVVLSTPALMAWVGAVDPGRATLLASVVDPLGLHLAIRVLLHNDREWRTNVLVSTIGTDEPTEMTLDVSFEDWKDGEHATDLLIARLHDALN